MQKNILRIGTTGTETTFLPENELPPCARLSGYSDTEMTDAEEEFQLKQVLETSKLEQGITNL